MRPEFIDEYIKTTNELKVLTKQQEYLKELVRAELENVGDLEDIYIQTSIRKSESDDLIYNWLKNKYKDNPELIKEFTRETIDWESWEHLLRMGKVSLEDMPKECVEEKEIKSVCIRRVKK